ncbi:MAG: VCBS repeat-containing protein [Polyangiales bacterium]
MTRWALLALLAVVAACRTKPATQLLVAVGTDIEVGDTLEQIEVEVGPSDGTSVFSRRTILVSRNPSPPFSVAMPFSFGVVPQGDDASRQVRVVARGRFRASGRRDRVVVTAITGFIEERSLLLPLYLQQRCVDVLECADGFTCRDGMCVDARVATSTLREVGVGFDPTLAFDASTADATDASDVMREDATDAAVIDAGDVTDASAMDVPADLATDAGADVTAMDVAADAARDGDVDAGADEGTITFDTGRLDGTTGSEAGVLDGGTGDVGGLSDLTTFEGGLTRDLPIATDDTPLVMPGDGFRWVAPTHGAWLSSIASRLRWRGAFPAGTRFSACFCSTAACAAPTRCTLADDPVIDGEDQTLVNTTSLLSSAGTGWISLRYGPPGSVTTALPPVFVQFAHSGAASQDRPAWRSVLDANGDGVIEVPVGASSSAAAEVRLYAADAPTYTRVTGASEEIGLTVAVLGDVNGDGLSDLALASMPGASDTGVALYHGVRATPPTFTSTNVPAPTGTTGFVATSFAAAGDVNRDGYSDLIVGAEPAAGRWFALYRGSTAGLSASAVTACDADPPSASFIPRAALVAGVGDFTGDGYADVAVASGTTAGTASMAANAVYVYPGSATGIDCTVRRAVTAPAGRDASWGRAVVAAGDVNHDGFADFMVTHATGVDLVRGSAGAPIVEALVAPPGQCSAAMVSPTSRWQAAGLGDVNGDGDSDVATGVLGGCAFLFRDNAGTATWGRTLTGPISSSLVPPFALALGGVGDLDGDGLADFAVSGVRDASDRVMSVFGGHVNALSQTMLPGLPARYETNDTLESGLGRAFGR